MFSSMSKPSYSLREEIINWVHRTDWSYSLSYTFTFPCRIAWYEDKTAMNIRYLFNRIDRYVYGGLQRRKNMRCTRYNVMEQGEQGGLYHLHGIIRIPDDKDANPKFTTHTGLGQLMEEIWLKKMDFNFSRRHRFEIKNAFHGTNTPSKWISYISKEIEPLAMQSSYSDWSKMNRLETTHLTNQ